MERKQGCKFELTFATTLKDSTITKMHLHTKLTLEEVAFDKLARFGSIYGSIICLCEWRDPSGGALNVKIMNHVGA